MSTENFQSCAKYDRTNDLVFKQYKHYKRKKPRPNFSNVIDVYNDSLFTNFLKPVDISNNVKDIPKERFCSVGLADPSTWKVFELTTCPGFIVVRNPFLSFHAQSHWVRQALTEYTVKPYPSNLDALMQLDEEKTMWQISHEQPNHDAFIKQLRWVHMGYHFDYNTVDYKAKKYYGFPSDLAQLTETIASVFAFPDYYAETGIINYYPEGASMGGHTDHYEEELCQPLISYSFGQSAVYLIGGDTRDIKPEAIWVRSGDLMLMTGASRTAFHAVPCVITKPQLTGPKDIGQACLLTQRTISKTVPCCCSETDNHVWKDAMVEDSWTEFARYLTNTRININIRQVHKHKS